PPAQCPDGFGKHLAGEDGDDGAVDAERAGAVHEEFAEGVAVVVADEAPEDGRAALDESAVGAAGGGGAGAILEDVDGAKGGLLAADHGEGDAGGEDGVEKTGGVADEEIAAARVGFAGVAEV